MPRFLEALSGSVATANAKSATDLEVLAKHASNRYGCGKYTTLRQAVVETVKTAGLTAQQVRRVCEGANTDAVLAEYGRDGRSDRYVDLKGGPADPQDVLDDLGMIRTAAAPQPSHNAGSEYLTSPDRSILKTASTGQPDALAGLLLKTATAVKLPGVDPEPERQGPDFEPLLRFYTRACSEYEVKTAAAATAKTAFANALEDVWELTRDGVRDGVGVADMVRIWGAATDLETVKTAAAYVGPRLISERVLTPSQYMDSFEKVGSTGVPNTETPVYAAAVRLKQCAVKLAEAEAARDECVPYLDAAKSLIKRAGAAGTVGKGVGAAVKGLGKGLGAAAGASGDLASGLVHGLGGGDELAGLAGLAGKALPYGAAGVVGLRAADAMVQRGQQFTESLPFVPQPHNPYGVQY